MRIPFACTAIALAGLSCAPMAAAQEGDEWDAVAAAPDSHQVLLENEKVRVLRVTIPPGAMEPIHDHRWTSVMYFEQPQPITYVAYELVDGKPSETMRVEAPALPIAATEWVEPEGLHAIRNRGDGPFVAVRVEFKDGDAPDE